MSTTRDLEAACDALGTTGELRRAVCSLPLEGTLLVVAGYKYSPAIWRQVAEAIATARAEGRAAVTAKVRERRDWYTNKRAEDIAWAECERAAGRESEYMNARGRAYEYELEANKLSDLIEELESP